MIRNLLRLGVLLGALVMTAHAQTIPEPTAAPTIPATSTFFGAGISLLPQTSPKPTGWVVAATEVFKTGQIYSLTETDYTVVNQKIQSSVRSGIATPLRTFGTITLYGLADAGVASTGGVTGSAYSGGGVLLIPLKNTNYLAIAGVRILHTTAGGSTTLFELGFGRKTK